MKPLSSASARTVRGMRGILLLGVLALVGIRPITYASHLRNEKRHHLQTANNVTCHLVKATIQFTARASHRTICKCSPILTNGTESAHSFIIPHDLVSKFEQDDLDMIQTAETYVRITNAHISSPENGVSAQLVTQPNSQMIVMNDEPLIRRRRLVPRIGTKSLLVLRVTATDSSLTSNAATLRKRIFTDSVTPVSVYRQCSFGQLRLAMATGEGIDGGIAEVSMNRSIVGADFDDGFENAIIDAATKIGLAPARFDHVIFCIPPGVTSVYGEPGDWTGYARYDGWLTVINDELCGSVSVVAHEIGHNYGLGHASRGDDLYGDLSGYMGYSFHAIGLPQMCFNALNNWDLGWYDDRKIDVTPPKFGAWIGTLNAFVDFEETQNGEYVLIKVDGVYVQYNRAKGFNWQTQGAANMVTITQSDVVFGVKNSDMVAMLNVSQSYKTTGNFVIRICDMGIAEGVDYALVSIHRTGQPTGCSSQIKMAPPEARPTRDPMTDQSLKPTAVLVTVPNEYSPTAIAPPPMTPDPGSGATSTTYCDDDRHGSFYVDAIDQYQRCVWLAPRPLLLASLCDEGHESNARHVCPETCGVCSDNCEDTRGKFSYGAPGKRHNCIWLGLRPGIQDEICVPGHDAYTVCPETCNACDSMQLGQSSQTMGMAPMASPTQSHVVPTPATNATCYDSEGVVYVEELGVHRGCPWLAVSQVYIDALCGEGHSSGARNVCPKTCGACPSNCEDTEGTFHYAAPGSKVDTYDCTWLALRPDTQGMVCVPGHEAFDVCPKTCNACDE